VEWAILQVHGPLRTFFERRRQAPVLNPAATRRAADRARPDHIRKAAGSLVSEAKAIPRSPARRTIQDDEVVGLGPATKLP